MTKAKKLEMVDHTDGTPGIENVVARVGDRIVVTACFREVKEYPAIVTKRQIAAETTGPDSRGDFECEIFGCRYWGSDKQSLIDDVVSQLEALGITIEE